LRREEKNARDEEMKERVRGFYDIFGTAHKKIKIHYYK